MRWQYYRDIWALGPSSNGYPGAFPRGLPSRIRKRWWGVDRCWLFSGSFKDEGGTTVDIKPELEPSVVADCEKLPFEDESFDFVMADPPYSEAEAKKLYDLSYPSMVKVLNEMERILKPNGYMLLLHRLIPQRHPYLSQGFKALEIDGIVGVFTLAGFTNMRALTVWRKPQKLEIEDTR